MSLPPRVPKGALDRALADEFTLNAKLRRLLRGHYMLRNRIAPTDRLGAIVGYATGGPVHFQYGGLGRRLAKRFSVRREEGWPSGHKSEVVIDFQEADVTDPQHEWYWQLSAPIAASLERLAVVKRGRWTPSVKREGVGLPDPVFGDPPLDAEGRKRIHEAMKAERSRANRNSVLLRHKSPYRCEACRMDFASSYGMEFGRVIQVHHKKPLAAGTQTPRPSQFLLLCPNCHVVAHYGRGLKPRALHLLRRLIASQHKLKPAGNESRA